MMLEPIALAATLAMASFNAYLLTWLGMTLLFSAEQKTRGLVGVSVSFISGAVYCVIQVIIIVTQVNDSAWAASGMLWIIARAVVIITPLAFYGLMQWLGGYSLATMPIIHRVGFGLCAAIALLLGGLLLAGWGDAIYQQGIFFNIAAGWQTQTIDIFIWLYHPYSILCHLLGWQVLGQSSRMQLGARSQMSQQQMATWLRRYAAGQIIGSLLTMGLYISAAVVAPAHIDNHAITQTASLSFNRPTMVVATAVLSAIYTASFLALGYATVVYEAFSGQVLGRKNFHRYWNHTLLLAATLASVIAILLVWEFNVLSSLLLVSAVSVGYHIWHSWQMIRTDAPTAHTLRRKQPFDASATSNYSLLQNEFNIVCRDYLNVTYAVLLPTGAAASFIKEYLCYPDNHSVDALPSLESGTYSIQQSIYLTQDPAYPWILLLWSGRGLLGLLYMSQRADGRLHTVEECQLAKQRIVELLEAIIATTITTHLMDLQRNRLAETRVMDLQTRRRLHDDVLPSLHMAILGLHAAKSTSEETVIQEAIDELGQLHQQIADLIRTVPHYTPDDQHDLLPLLNQMLHDEFAAAFDTATLQTTLQHVYVPPMILEVVNGAIYEGLRNAAIHGRGDDPTRHLQVTLSVTYPSDLVIDIIDNGVGIQAETSSHGGSHHGIALHKTLVAVVGGTIDIDNLPSGGTRFTLTIARHAIKDLATTFPSATPE